MAQIPTIFSLEIESRAYRDLKKLYIFQRPIFQKKRFDFAIISASLKIQKKYSGLGVVTCDVEVWST